MTIVNAKITGMWWDDERGLTHEIGLDGDGWGVCFGGYLLKGDAAWKWISQLMRVLEVDRLSDKIITGKIVRARFEGNGGCGDRVISIGHPYKDIWLDPKELSKSE